MHDRKPRRPSPSMAVALLALFVALGGTAVAARHYLISSPGQVKPSVRASLRGARGATGPTGQTGPTGKQGPTGETGSEVARVTSDERGPRGAPSLP